MFGMPTCKVEHKKPPELLVQLPIPEWKWICITMDFITGFPRTPQGLDAIWIVVDRVTKSAYFVPIQDQLSNGQISSCI